MLSLLGLAAIARLASALTCTGCTSTDNDCVEFVADSVYGCDGEWTSNGVMNGAYLCAEGYEICPTDDRAAELGLTAELCTSETLSDGDFYATLQGASTGEWPSCGDGGTDDVFGCAKNALRPDGNYAYTEAQYQSDQMDATKMFDCGPLKAALGQDVGYGVPKWGCCAESTNEVYDLKHESADGGGVLCCKEESPYHSNFFVDDVSDTLNAQPAAVFGDEHPPCVETSFEGGEYATYTCAQDKMSVTRKLYSDNDCETQVGDMMVFTANDTMGDNLYGFYCEPMTTSYVTLDYWVYGDELEVSDSMDDCPVDPLFEARISTAVDNCYAGLDQVIMGTEFMIYEKYTCDETGFTVTDFYDELCSLPVNSSLRVGDECTPFADVTINMTDVSIYAQFVECVINGEIVSPTAMPTPAPVEGGSTAPPAPEVSVAPGYQHVVAAVFIAVAGAVLRE